MSRIITNGCVYKMAGNGNNDFPGPFGTFEDARTWLGNSGVFEMLDLDKEDEAIEILFREADGETSVKELLHSTFRQAGTSRKKACGCNRSSREEGAYQPQQITQQRYQQEKGKRPAPAKKEQKGKDGKMPWYKKLMNFPEGEEHGRKEATSGEVYEVERMDGVESYQVLRSYPTKGHADGPFPKDLLRLVDRDGGAALVELLTPPGYEAQDTLLVSEDSSLPRYFFLALQANGEPDGKPIGLSPAQYNRAMSYEYGE